MSSNWILHVTGRQSTSEKHCSIVLPWKQAALWDQVYYRPVKCRLFDNPEALCVKARPDIVVRHTTAIVMFTHPREDKEDCKRKMLRYTGLEAKVGECGWSARWRPGCCKTVGEPSCELWKPLQSERSLNAETAAAMERDYSLIIIAWYGEWCVYANKSPKSSEIWAG